MTSLLDDRSLMIFQFGKIQNIDIKRPARPPFFAFVEYTDPRRECHLFYTDFLHDEQC